MGARGFEPRTSALSELRSNQLSYAPLASLYDAIRSPSVQTRPRLIPEFGRAWRKTPLNPGCGQGIDDFGGECRLCPVRAFQFSATDCRVADSTFRSRYSRQASRKRRPFRDLGKGRL